MAGGEDDPTALRGVGGQIADFRERRRGRLFQQDVLAGVDRLAREAVADVGRRADRDGVETRRGCIELGGRCERGGALDLRARPADDADKAEVRIVGDDRKVLVAGNLADADDRDRVWRHLGPSEDPKAN